MNAIDTFVEGFNRVEPIVRAVVEGLNADQLAFRLDDEANTIGWLVWHLSRVQDDHIADVSGDEQLWTAKGWAERFALPFTPDATGYDQTPDEVSSVRASEDDLLDYFEVVHAHTVSYLRSLADRDLDRVVDNSFVPAVTLGVRLMSVLADELQHAGQAAFVRGMLRDDEQ